MDKAKLMEFVERIEYIDDQVAVFAADRKEILNEAKAAGFSKKALSHVIRQRKKDRDQIAEERELFAAYEKAVGL